MSHVDCPTCGHNTSAFAGSCTAFILHTQQEVDNTGRYGRHCGHDCSVDVLEESLHDRFVRTMWGDKQEAS